MDACQKSMAWGLPKEGLVSTVLNVGWTLATRLCQSLGLLTLVIQRPKSNTRYRVLSLRSDAGVAGLHGLRVVGPDLHQDRLLYPGHPHDSLPHL